MARNIGPFKNAYRVELAGEWLADYTPVRTHDIVDVDGTTGECTIRMNDLIDAINTYYYGGVHAFDADITAYGTIPDARQLNPAYAV